MVFTFHGAVACWHFLMLPMVLVLFAYLALSLIGPLVWTTFDAAYAIMKPLLSSSSHDTPFALAQVYLISFALTAAAVVAGALLFVVVLGDEGKEPPPKGCKRLGLVGKSNLKDQYSKDHAVDQQTSRVKALVIYPIKSCRPVELDHAKVIPTGLEYDRQFTFAQLKSNASLERTTHEWHFITQREAPNLAQVKTELWVPDSDASDYDPKGEWVQNGGCIHVRFPFTPEIDFSVDGLAAFVNLLRAKWAAKDWTAQSERSFRIPYNPTSSRIKQKRYTTEPMRIWKEWPHALNMETEISSDALKKLRYCLGLSNPITLFRSDPTQPREVFRCAPRKDTGDVSYQPIVSMQDAYPLHILALSSIRDVDSKVSSGTPFRGELDALRFRANIYTTGTAAFDEDSWKRVKIGSTGGEYHISCRTARCTLPNVDPITGIKDRNEPRKAMSAYRKIDEGVPNEPCLGMQAVPMSQEAEISVGDEIEILQRGEHFYIKQ